MLAAVLARETMLVGVTALALWELMKIDGSFIHRVRRVLPFAVPVAALAAWDKVIRLRLGAWPTGSAETRVTLPGIGLLDSLSHRPTLGLALGVTLAIGLWLAPLM